MKNLKIKIYSVLAIIYILIGLYFWWSGYIPNAPFPENIFTFLYIVFLWPFTIGLFILLNQIYFMEKPKYFLYARKSTEDDDKQVMSIEAQIYELREFAKKENLQILAEFTESKSAKTPGRSVFGEMMASIEEMENVGILSWHPDRLARNSIDGGKIIYFIDQKNISSLRFPTFWFEPTPQGLFMLQVAFGQSKYYSDNLVENVKRGIRQKLRKGEWLSKAPFGYVNNQKTRNIEPHPLYSKVIVKAFNEYKK